MVRVVFSGGWRIALLASCGIAVAGGGCAKHDPPLTRGEPARSIAAALNPSPTIADFVLYASHSIAVREKAVVAGADVGVRAAGTPPFLMDGVELGVGEKATVALGRTLLADSVLLRDKSVVGDVQTNELVDKGSTHGLVQGFVAMPELPALSPVTPGTTDLTVPESGTADLDCASAYASVKLREKATLRVAGGVCQLAQLEVGEKARLEVLSTVQLRKYDQEVRRCDDCYGKNAKPPSP
jgi:hypothetical protein